MSHARKRVGVLPDLWRQVYLNRPRWSDTLSQEMMSQELQMRTDLRMESGERFDVRVAKYIVALHDKPLRDASADDLDKLSVVLGQLVADTSLPSRMAAAPAEAHGKRDVGAPSDAPAQTPVAPPAPPAEGRQVSLQAPPGATTLRVARLVFGKRTYDEVVVQTIADMRDEYFEALRDGEPWRARFTYLRGMLALMRALGVESVLRWLWRTGRQLIS